MVIVSFIRSTGRTNGLYLDDSNKSSTKHSNHCCWSI